MKLIPISATPRQRLQVPLEDGNLVTLTLRYLPAVEQWFIKVEYSDFTLDGCKIHNSFNMLHLSSRLIPFGIRIRVIDGGEPFLLEDFSSGRVQFFVLNKEEVQAISNYYTTRPEGFYE